MGQGPPHRGDSGPEGVAHPGLGDDRRALGESIGDGHLPTMHFLDHLFHHLDGTGRAGHDSGPQGAQIDPGEFGVLQFPNEHGRHAVDSRASLLLDRLQRGPGIEGLGGNDHGGSVNGAGHVSQHHAEAVVEGHRNADTVPAGELHPLTHQVGVVDDVVVGEHGPLGITRGSGGVLDIYGIISPQGGIRFVRHPRGFGSPTAGNHCIPGPHSRQGLPLSGQNQVSEVRKTVGPPVVRARASRFGTDFGNHLQVVRRPEAANGDERLGLRLFQGVVKLARPVTGVDVDHDGADARRGELGQDPLGAIGRPDGDPVPLPDSHGRQPTGDLIDPFQELFPPQADALGNHHQGFPLGIPGCSPLQNRSNGRLEQGSVARSASVAQTLFAGIHCVAPGAEQLPAIIAD